MNYPFLKKTFGTNSTRQYGACNRLSTTAFKKRSGDYGLLQSKPRYYFEAYPKIQSVIRWYDRYSEEYCTSWIENQAILYGMASEQIYIYHSYCGEGCAAFHATVCNKILGRECFMARDFEIACSLFKIIQLQGDRYNPFPESISRAIYSLVQEHHMWVSRAEPNRNAGADLQSTVIKYYRVFDGLCKKGRGMLDLDTACIAGTVSNIVARIRNDAFHFSADLHQEIGQIQRELDSVEFTLSAMRDKLKTLHEQGVIDDDGLVVDANKILGKLSQESNEVLSDSGATERQGTVLSQVTDVLTRLETEQNSLVSSFSEKDSDVQIALQQEIHVLLNGRQAELHVLEKDQSEHSSAKSSSPEPESIFKRELQLRRKAMGFND